MQYKSKINSMIKELTKYPMDNLSSLIGFADINGQKYQITILIEKVK